MHLLFPSLFSRSIIKSKLCGKFFSFVLNKLRYDFKVSRVSVFVEFGKLFTFILIYLITYYLFLFFIFDNNTH